MGASQLGPFCSPSPASAGKEAWGLPPPPSKEWEAWHEAVSCWLLSLDTPALHSSRDDDASLWQGHSGQAKELC